MLWLLIVIIVIGVVIHLVPMDPEALKLVRIGLVVLFIIWLIALLFGGLDLTAFPPHRGSGTVIVH